MPSEEQIQKHDSALLELKQRKSAIDDFNRWLEQMRKDRICYWEARKAAFDAEYLSIEELWKKSRADWGEAVGQEMLKLKALSEGYKLGEQSSVIEYFRTQLDAVVLPAWCPKKYSVQFDDESRILLVELQLPHLDNLEVKKTRNLKHDYKLVPATQKEAREFRNKILYLIALRILWEIPMVDTAKLLELVCVNGFVTFADPASGRMRTDTVLSVSAKPDELREILLDRVDPEQCFKGLKGVGGARISELVPIQPIIRFDRSDSRFVIAKDVLDDVGDKNLATMEWQDFEYLIREIFEKEFSMEGAEVKVTQASRDRGVDAIVFDPDPIRGGKYVIQAKRYTNIVDVSAVRDLYGTVMNEGASKGILVTTSNYGRDAYEFAKDKPITLMNGSNLLHLLEKHGYSLKIDLKEARRLLRESADY